MRSMFTSAPFTRFDLGRHILGQAQAPLCPPGQIPLLIKGEVKCVEGFTPGSMMSTVEEAPAMSVPAILPTTTMGQAPVGVPQPAAGGISTKDILIGGAVVVGVGLLLSAIL